MKFTYTCNNCPQLSITEAEQERLRLHGEERFHWDTGRNRTRNIYPCSECEADMKK